MADTLTKNFKFVKPQFNKKPWQQNFYDALDAIDAVLARYILVSNFVGVWNQATAYTAGQRVVDTVGGAIYTCNVSHTSTAINTFAQDRIANPTFWTIFTFSVQFRGTWLAQTDYSTGDFVVFGQRLAVANSTHHSSNSFVTDQANGLWNVLIDGTAVVALPSGTAANADQVIRYDGPSLQYQLAINTVKLSSTGVLTLPAGAAGAPTLTLNGQGGLFSPGANLVAVAVGGIEIMRLKSDGTTTLAFPDLFRQGQGFPAAAAANAGQSLGWDAVTGLTIVNQGPLSGFKNRLINGDMRIDQRFAGAANTFGSGGATATYCVDRWFSLLTGGSTESLQLQRVVSTIAGFPFALNFNNLAAVAAPNAAANVFVAQPIEGLNVSDLAWGTASAKTVVLSFWATASTAGTYGGAILNNAGNRSYVFQYTIAVGGTPQFFQITIPGDTTGTWLIDTAIGMYVAFDVGSGSNFETAANIWTAGNFKRSAGNGRFTSTISTTRAQITGVQLEIGTSSHRFDNRAFGTELMLCQRYFCKSFPMSVAPAQNTGINTSELQWLTVVGGANNASSYAFFPVTMRVAPTVTLYNPGNTNAQIRTNGIGDWSGCSVGAPGERGTIIQGTQNAGATIGTLNFVHYAATAEM